MSSLRYRPDLDGLRAVAILAVLLFHAGLSCPGGFVGVDVFFVLSGFLITSMIAPEITEGRFSFQRFWERRLRRLAPAMIVLVGVVLAAGWVILLPNDYRETAQASVAHAFLAANVYFWREAGYFATASETKPLLHLWSLAIEEQFYVLLPPLLWLIARARWRMWPVSMGLMALSLGWSIWSTPRNPDAAFFLLPARAWELLLGVNVALLMQPLSTRLTPISRQALSFAGMSAIAYSLCMFSHATVFPGAAALLPCGGTAALILANATGETISTRVLSLSPITFLGKISYSVYLWHWPLLALLAYVDAAPSVGLRVAAIGLSLVIGTLSWAYVERPVRERQFLPTRRAAFAGFAFASLLVVTTGLALHAAGGVRGRFDPEVLELADVRKTEWRKAKVNTITAAQITRQGLPWLNEVPGAAPRLAVIGDSHAAALMPLIADVCEKLQIPAVAASRPATAPLFFGGDKEPADKREFQEAVLQAIQASQLEHVILVARWAGHRAEIVSDENLKRSVEALQAAGATVWILKQVPEQKGAVPRALALARHWGTSATGCRVTLDEYQHAQSTADSALAAVQDEARWIDPTEFFFADGPLCRVELEGRPLFNDDDHLSPFGALQLRPLLSSLIGELTKPTSTASLGVSTRIAGPGTKDN